MATKLKARKCKLRTCRKEFLPVVKWQEFCSVKCRTVVQTQKMVKLLRAGQKAIDAGKGAA